MGLAHKGATAKPTSASSAKTIMPTSQIARRSGRISEMTLMPMNFDTM